jgi:hypothetical protein
MLDGNSLLRLAQAYSAATSLTLTGISKRACPKNDKVFLRLTTGRTITQRTAEAVERFFRANWPENAEWPNGIPGKPKKTVPAFTSRWPERIAAKRVDCAAA